MKKLLLNFMLTCSFISIIGCAANPFKVSGSIDYTKKLNSPQETLKKAVELKYRQNLHETSDKKYLVYLGGKIYLDHDVFGNTSRVNTMTSLGLEF
jgi:hypothetical protein